MTINDQIRDEKLQYINREAAKTSALSSGKIHKYEYLTGEDILPSNQQQIIEQAKFTYSPLGKAFEKQIKTIEDQGQKQVDALNVLEPKAIERWSNIKPVITQEFYDKILEESMDEILRMSDEIDFDYLIYKSKQNEIKGTGLKMLTPKQMFQILPIALAQVKAANNSETLLNEIKQIVYSLHQSKQITKKVYNNIIKSIQL